MHKQIQGGKKASSSCIASAWTPFVENLATVLEGLQEDQFLVISVKKSNSHVQFAAQGAHGLRMETTSNHYLDKTERLTEEQIAMLTSIGWKLPANCPEEATPEKDPEGSPNFSIDYSLPVPGWFILMGKRLTHFIRVNDGTQPGTAAPQCGTVLRATSEDENADEEAGVSETKARFLAVL